MLAHNIPEGDFQGRKGAGFGASIAMIHNVVHRETPKSLNIERVLSQGQRRQGAVNGGFGGRDFIDGFAQADDAAVGDAV